MARASAEAKLERPLSDLDLVFSGQTFFAGEATHNSSPSTVPGALRSSERAAGEMNAAAAIQGPLEFANRQVGLVLGLMSPLFRLSG